MTLSNPVRVNVLSVRRVYVLQSLDITPSNFSNGSAIVDIDYIQQSSGFISRSVKFSTSTSAGDTLANLSAAITLDFVLNSLYSVNILSNRVRISELSRLDTSVQIRNVIGGTVFQITNPVPSVTSPITWEVELAEELDVDIEDRMYIQSSSLGIEYPGSYVITAKNGKTLTVRGLDTNEPDPQVFDRGGDEAFVIPLLQAGSVTAREVPSWALALAIQGTGISASGVSPGTYTDPDSISVLETGQISEISSGVTAIRTDDVGVANGVASLDGTSRIPLSQLPIAALTHQGAWNANTNTPTLTSGTGTDGDIYWVTVAGSTDLDSGTTGSNTWSVGDAAIFVAATSSWHRIPASALSSNVQSVNGLTGTVVLNFSNLNGGTLAQLNSLVSDATLDDSSSSRPIPNSGVSAGTYTPPTTLTVGTDGRVTAIASTNNIPLNMQLITSNITVTPSDHLTYYLKETSTSINVTLPESSTVFDGFSIVLSNELSTTGGLIAFASGSDTVDGLAGIGAEPGATIRYVLVGTDYKTIFYGLRSLSLAGDVTGTTGDNEVTGLRDVPIQDVAPTDNQVLVYSSSNNRWEPSTLSAGSLVTPEIFNFHTTVPSRVNVGGLISGTFTATYELNNAQQLSVLRLIGVQVTPSGTTVIINSSVPKIQGLNSVEFTFPGNPDFTTSGNLYRLTLEGYVSGDTPGVDSPTVTSSRNIRTQNTALNNLLYYGSSVSNIPSSIDVLTLSTSTRFTGNFTIPTYSGSRYIVVAYPSSQSDYTQVLIGQVNQLAGFTLTETAVSINSVDYDFLISNNELLGSVMSNEILTLVR